MKYDDFLNNQSSKFNSTLTRGAARANAQKLLPNLFSQPTPPPAVVTFKGDRSLYDSTVGSFLAGAADVGGLVSRGIGALIPGDDWFDDFGKSMEDFVQKHPEYAPEEVQNAWDLITSPSAIISRISYGLPYVLAVVGAVAGGELLAGAAASVAAGSGFGAGAAAMGAATGAGVAAAPAVGGIAGALGVTSAAAGWGLGAGFMTSAFIEGRRGYESALADGQDESTATLNGAVQGLIGGMLNLIPVNRLFKSSGAMSISQALTKNTMSRLEANGVKKAFEEVMDKAVVESNIAGKITEATASKMERVKQAIKFNVSQSMLFTSASAVQDLIPYGIYGKKLPEGYFDELAQRLVVNGATQEAVASIIPHKILADGDPNKLISAIEQANEKYSYTQKLQNINDTIHAQYSDKSEASALSTLVTTMAGVMGDGDVDAGINKLISGSVVPGDLKKSYSVDDFLASTGKILQLTAENPIAGTGRDVVRVLGDNNISIEDLHIAGVLKDLQGNSNVDGSTIMTSLLKSFKKTGKEFLDEDGSQRVDRAIANLITVEQQLDKAKPKTNQEAEAIQQQRAAVRVNTFSELGDIFKSQSQTEDGFTRKIVGDNVVSTRINSKAGSDGKSVSIFEVVVKNKNDIVDGISAFEGELKDLKLVPVVLDKKMNKVVNEFIEKYGVYDKDGNITIRPDALVDVENLISKRAGPGIDDSISVLRSLGKFVVQKDNPTGLLKTIINFALDDSSKKILKQYLIKSDKDLPTAATDAFIKYSLDENFIPISLQPAFKKVAELASSAMKNDISGGVSRLPMRIRSIFDSMFRKEIGDVVGEIKAKIITLEQEIKKSPMSKLSKGALEILEKESKDNPRVDYSFFEKQKKLVDLYGELNIAHMKQYEPDTPSTSELLRKSIEEHQIKLAHTEYVEKGWIKKAGEDTYTWLGSSFVDQTKALEGIPGGREVVKVLNITFNKTMLWKSQWAHKIADTFKSLSIKDQNLLAGMVDISITKDKKYKFSGLRVLLDEKYIPKVDRDMFIKKHIESKGIRKLLAFAKELHDKSAIDASKAGGMRNVGDAWVPIRVSEQMTFPRKMEDKAYRVIVNEAGEAYNKIIEAAIELNEGLQKKYGTNDPTILKERLKKDLKEYAELGFKSDPALSMSRTIPVLPDAIIMNDGSVFQIYHSDPIDTMGKIVNSYARHIANLEVFGQGVLKPAHAAHAKQLLNALIPRQKVGGRYVPTSAGKLLSDALGLRVTKNGDVSMGRSPDAIKEDIRNLTDLELKDIKYKDLLTLANSLNVKTRFDMDSLVDAISPGGAVSGIMPEVLMGREKELVGVAKSLGGISITRTTPQKLFLDIIKRMEEKFTATDANGNVIDTSVYMVDKFRENIKREGGMDQVEWFNHLWAVSQGVPPSKRYEKSYNPVNIATRFAVNTTAIAQTSLAAVPNMFQPLALGPLLGFRNIMKAYALHFKDPESARMLARETGAFADTITSLVREPGSGLDGFGKRIRQIGNILTGQRYFTSLNNEIIALSSKFFLENIQSRKSGITPAELRILKAFKVEDITLDKFKNGTFTKQDMIEASHRAVASTQFITENPIHKSLLETNPITKNLFLYMNYATGTIRTVNAVTKEFFGALRSGNVKDIMGTTMKIVGMVGGMYGAGVASALVRQSIKGNFSQLEDKEFDFVGALAEVSILGPANRVISASSMDGDDSNKFLISLSPSLTVLSDGLSVVMGNGKYGNFDIGRRMAEFGLKNTPAMKAFRSWATKLAYPSTIEYDAAKGDVSRFLKGFGDRSGGFSNQPLNADYYRLFDLVYKNEIPEAEKLIQSLLKKAVDDGEDPVELLSKLRQSLVGRSPMRIPEKLLPVWLEKAEESTRSRVSEAQVNYMDRVNYLIPKPSPARSRASENRKQSSFLFPSRSSIFNG